MNTVLVIALFGLLALASTDVSAISCFQCNSHIEPECANLNANDTSSPFFKVCTPTGASGGKELFCRKTVQMLFELDQVHTRVIRSCGWVKYPRNDCYSFRNKGHEDISCQCFTDGCNAAPISVPTISFIIGLPLIASLLLYK